MPSLKRRNAEAPAPLEADAPPAPYAGLSNPFRRSDDLAKTDRFGLGGSDDDLSRDRIEAILSNTRNDRSTWLGLSAFAFGLSLFLLTLSGVVAASTLPLKLAASVVNGVAIAVLFVVGHDACHGSLTPHDRLNAWIARLAFLPSLHPYSAWLYSHNILHHGWTNLKGRDPVYPPKSLEEYEALSPWEKRLERFRRSLPGVGLLYFQTIWIPFEMFPAPEKRKQIERYGDFAGDRRLVAVFLMLLLGCLALVSNTVPVFISNVLFSFALPFVIWLWLMGFVTFLHHTHPEIRWVDNRREWSFGQAQIRGSAHVVFPAFFDVLFLRIMHHTAHHASPRTPLYRLRARQAPLDAHAPTYRLSLQACQDIFATCQLYDYRKHHWLRFPSRDAADLPVSNELANKAQRDAARQTASSDEGDRSGLAR